MFTGIIEEIGVIKSISKGSKSSQLTISASKVLKDVKLGDSIATNGACLTVVSFSSTEFTVDVMAETVRKTTLQKLTAGDKVNLERALRVGDRLGGHMVSGHIDGVGTIRGLLKEENAIWVNIETSSAILKYIIAKGSVAIDGISLTVAEVSDTAFKVSIIPHTAEETTLLKKKIGNQVNLENDLVGKYIERFMLFKTDARSGETQQSKVDMGFLGEHGFL
ncbi:MAG: riboflavin synthase [Bacteroidales bacterium]|nr:riboflavin synthase [Bacteroidales bacterium]